MAGTTTDIRIASNALQLLGHTAITKFDEGTAGADIASALYDITYESNLTEYRWRFATKTARLARLTEAPLEDFLYKFQLPTDMLYVIRPTISNLRYEIYEDTIHTDSTELAIDYIYNVPADRLPPYYVQALQFLLASQFAIPVTGSESKAQLYFNMYKEQLKKARNTDSTQRPQESFEDNPYVDVRN
jgi:hypothetical protein